ncbi:hypothetical protein [Arthrobacter pigmenti]
MSEDTEEQASQTWEAESFNAAGDPDVDLWSTASPAEADQQEAKEPFVDPDIEAELDAGPPSWMGVRWRDIDPADKPEARTALRHWVDWFIREYQLKSTMLPPCWFEHADMVAELYAAMCAEYKIWEEGSPGLGAMTTWHPHVQAMRTRLAAMTAARTCNAKKKHAPDLPDLPWSYNEGRWAQVRDGDHQIDELPRADEDTFWHPLLVKETGEFVTGNELRVRGRHRAEPMIEDITVLSDAERETAQVRSYVSGSDVEPVWEYWDSSDGQWERHVPSETATDTGSSSTTSAPSSDAGPQ